jgi:hypothetical protein
MRARDLVRDANFGEEGVEFFIFSTPITLNSDDLSTKSSLNKGLKIMEFVKHFGFKLE